MVKRRTVRSGLAVTAALCAIAALPGTAAADPGDLPAYAVAEDAEPVEGHESSTGGPALEPGTYTDTIGPGEKKYYSVPLDDRSNAWISAVARPGPGVRVAYGDGIKVALQAPDGTTCGESDINFGSEDAARPIADHAWRIIKPDGNCQQSRVYHFSVERRSAATSHPSPWPVEIRFMQEPGLKSITSTTPPEEPGKTPSPSGPPMGETRPVKGGTGFNDAAGMGEGNWSDRLRPGETRFYRVPLDWGQRLHVNLEFGTAKAKEGGYVSGAFRVDLYNPARGHVVGESAGYRPDKPAELPLASVPVDFTNRYDSSARLGNTGFAGWYYIAVYAHRHLTDSVSGSVPVVLRTSVEGSAKPAPDYDGDAVAAGFGVTEKDREAAARGQSAAEAETSGTMRTVAWVGIGAGTVLLLGLGLWTLIARRSGGPR
ncbi:MAG TPA: hypothetical protein VFY14_09540 [Streptomyces sp.]|nr:hypothetical protein [Streptomyces sp.]